MQSRATGLAALGDVPVSSADETVLPLSDIRELAARLGGQISVHANAAEGNSRALSLPEG